MPNNTNAQAISFANNYARKTADELVRCFLTCQRCQQIWNGQSVVTVIPNDASPIQDGATVASGVADGRSPITNAQVNILISNLATVMAVFTANTNLILNQSLAVSVNGSSAV